MDSTRGKMQPVDVFPSMFERHLEAADYNLVIGNLVLLRNIFKQVVKDSHASASEKAEIDKAEELWMTIGKGCGCTRNKRLDTAASFMTDFLNSESGKAVLAKVKSVYKLKTLVVNIPDPVLKFEV